MSWDVVIFNLNKKVSSVEEINEDVIIPISNNKEFRQLLIQNFPDIKWEGNRGIIESNNIYIELFIGEVEEDTFSNIIFFLRESEASIFPVITLCKKYGWQLFDTSLEQMIDLDSPEKNGYSKYRSYVDMIMKKK